MRLRLRRHSLHPRPGIYLADTPHPRCTDCYGKGEWADWSGAPEAPDVEMVPCDCWDPGRYWLLLPLPRRPRQRRRDRAWPDTSPF